MQKGEYGEVDHRHCTRPWTNIIKELKV